MRVTSGTSSSDIGWLYPNVLNALTLWFCCLVLLVYTWRGHLDAFIDNRVRPFFQEDADQHVSLFVGCFQLILVKFAYLSGFGFLLCRCMHGITNM